nr:hypothetical protein [Riptortus pedestris]
MSPVKSIILMAALVCAAHAQTTTPRTGIFGNLFGQQLQAMKTGINVGADLKSKGLQLAMNTTRQGVAGVLGAKQSVMNMMAGMGSNFLQYGTDLAKGGVAIAQAMTPNIPILKESVAAGAGIVGAMATAGNAMGQTGIATLNAGGKALTEGITSAVNSGTQVVSDVGTSVIDMKKGALNTAVDMGVQGVAMADAGVDALLNGYTSALETVNGLSGRVSAGAADIAEQSKASLQATIAGSGSLSTGTGTVSGSGSLTTGTGTTSGSAQLNVNAQG